MIDWIKIDNLSNSRQNELFAASIRVYRELFNPEVAEPAKNFEGYIKDNKSRRSQNGGDFSKDDFEDFYYVGVIDDAVCGMMLFTGYLESFSFISYMGIIEKLNGNRIDSESRRKLIDMMPSVISSSLINLGCHYYLFEIEKVHPEVLELRRHDIRIEHECNIRARIMITNGFQRKRAKKIGWITYRQPKLSWDAENQEVPMHLMYAPTSIYGDNRIELSQNEVKKIIKLIYLKFYMDGICQSNHNRAELKSWRHYFRELMEDSIDGLPEKVRLLKIDIRKPQKRVFISYPDSQRRMARMAQEYLEALGIPTFYWGRDSRMHMGKRLADEIHEQMKESKFILFILTSQSRDAGGQIDEAAWYREHGSVHGIGAIPIITKAFLPSHVENWLGDNYIFRHFNPTDRDDVCMTIEEVGKFVLEQSKS